MTTRRRRTLRTGTAAGALLLALAACGGPGQAGQSAGPPVEGGQLTYALSVFPKCVDPALQARGLSAPQQFVETLTDQDRTTGEIVPRLAESWEVSPDARSVTFHLRQGVTFSDGTPLTADVVKANIDSLKALSAEGKTDTPLISSLNSYQGTTVLDPATFRVDFGDPELGFLRNVSDPYFGIYAASTVASSYDDRCAGTSLVGTGPYVVDNVVKNQKIELSKRADYDWAPAGVTNHTGAGHLDKIVFEVVPESGVRVGGLLSGQFDVADDIPVTDQDSITGAGNQLLTGLVPNLVPGLRQNPFSPLGGDAVVRTAIQKSIDRAEIRDTLYNDHYSLPTSVVASNTPYYTDESRFLQYDPEGAKKLLSDNGWTTGADGVWQKDGLRLAPRVIYVSGTVQGATQQELELIQQQLKRVGIELQLLPGTQTEYTAVYNDKKNNSYDFLTGSGPAKDVDFLAGLFNKTNPALGGADQPELQAASERLNLASTDAERRAAAADLQELIISKGYWIPVREQTKAVGIRSGVQGVAIDPYGATVLYDAWKQDAS
ncbi:MULTISPECIES: ABC transporter substrate-binding protein [Pseudonocardia]|uniref:Peptide/nickel transport system substrate-binding protein n=1 Tax=Pseudonocardia oroxyli TaxID=366584 RepID=A0A1G8C7A0_PSEOR|nr:MULTISPECIES: ABC transporter substrate-binding protein [Pseudonocardia]MCF7550630.1 ABC transporter substrate-binding protein [Pseudonocardia sp. WMMC193]SDH41401.1 peptide/nickel transport system substrate-binding protein [Pseudonocardia oroxyli]